ncbi:type III sulfide quinone reductase, selenoprotein subtype [Amycolatopsis benzoatilytica]|uniref:type III sulfide quinone reductase, selenoprotein subtype n=1 Tax=Amycolatopsis benzoatilytica TaxID=346045 RepID=UPI00036534D4|nr:FAD/NAD(P)-binding oxidoreductase [Amycolatopsis benzoatilytica]
MTKHIVILGGGTGGTLAANRLQRGLGERVRITVVDRDDDHLYQPGLLFVPFGLAEPEDLVRSRPRQLRKGIEYHRSAVDHVDADAAQVRLEDGTMLGYDALVIASGARLVPEETEGLTGPGWRETVHTFYDYDGAMALSAALDGFSGGRLVVNVVDLPIKCPVAPLEFCFLADWYFREKGIRDQVAITYATPLDAAFTKPVAAKTLAGLLAEKDIELVTEFNTGQVDGPGRRLVSYDDREIPFDLAVVVPMHSGASYVDRSPGLGDEFGFVPVDPHTLQSTAFPNVFAIGDAAGVPTSKAGSVTHFEGAVLARNVARYLEGRPLDPGFDGHTNCFIESGFHKAMLIDFNYDTEPLPGHFPAAAGLPLLRESRLNHLGKLMFSWLYWHSLLPGREIPGIPDSMPRSGKEFPVPAEH